MTCSPAERVLGLNMIHHHIEMSPFARNADQTVQQPRPFLETNKDMVSNLEFPRAHSDDAFVISTVPTVTP